MPIATSTLILAVNQLEELPSHSSRRPPRPVRTSELSAQERREKERCQARTYTSRIPSSIESSPSSWLKVEISPTTMELVARVFTEPSLLMKTSSTDTLGVVLCPWLTLVLEAMALNSSCASELLLIWMASMLCSVELSVDSTY